MYNKKIFKRYFCYPKRYWYKNLRNIPRYFRSVRHLVKHGYDDYATYETFAWFTQTMRDILTEFRRRHYGYKVFDWNKSEEENNEMWENTIGKMIALLDDMDEDNPKYEDTIKDPVGTYGKIEAAKDEFFSLFSQYFFDLWD